ncbi:MAG: biopolymer transporter ExbD [Aquincola sp.]|nr:biopolymer transporter ExbD [Aquincola sp.]MDH4287791.1 biopolymer transporter ExbD [Aquincola sp.]MDH5331444.1 biopolymer transporter ExbD [Aquincola sp.]
MTQLTGIQKRAERKSRNHTGLDMNLVSLIDIFTILIFFLMSSAAGVEILNTSKAVKLPESHADKLPRETVVIVVAGQDILVDGRKVTTVDEALATVGDEIAPLKAELALHASKQVVRAENKAQSKAVTIMGDKDIPYRLLRKVMATAARADYSDVSFAVTKKVKA